MSRFNISAIIRSEAVMTVIRRELKRAFPELRPTIKQIRELVESEVLKREVVEGDKAAEAERSMRKANRPLRQKRPTAQRSKLARPSSSVGTPPESNGGGSGLTAEA